MDSSKQRLVIRPDSRYFLPFGNKSHHYNYYGRPLMNWLNWNRLDRVFGILSRRGLLSSSFSVLELGCGGGILLPTLSRNFGRVIACDLHNELNIVRTWVTE